MSHVPFPLPPGFDELSTEAKVDYVTDLWERISAGNDLQSPDWHHDLVCAELAECHNSPDAVEDWTSVRTELVDQLSRHRQ